MPARDEPAPLGASETLEILRTRSLADVVFQEIERRILEGEIEAGGRLNEAELAATLAVSRGPIREALRKLEQAGLVESVVNRGVFVRELGVAEALEIYEVRGCLAARAGRLLAARITPEQVAELYGLVERMRGPAAAGDIDGYYPLNLEFHRRVLELAGNRRLAACYLAMDKELHLFRRRSLYRRPAMIRSNREHERIVAALEAHDPTRAARTMERHILSGRGRMLRSAPPEPPSPEEDPPR